jgi:PleD family two-component response regulator
MLKKILLIDDDEDEMEVLVNAFKRIGIHAEWEYEKRPENAVTVLKHFHPDLVFIDYNMPKINGLTCVQDIRAVESLEDIRLVLYSSNITEEIQLKANELGAISCIEKTYSIEALVNKIIKLLKIKFPA